MSPTQHVSKHGLFCAFNLVLFEVEGFNQRKIKLFHLHQVTVPHIHGTFVKHHQFGFIHVYGKKNGIM